MIQAIKIHNDDNVAVAVGSQGLRAGEILESEGLKLIDDVPQGHKIALTDIPSGAPVIRYGVTIARAKDLIPAGSWVKEALVEIPPSPALDELVYKQPQEKKMEPLEGYTFMGFRNPDRSVGTRNILGISTTVQCVSGVVNHVVKVLKEKHLSSYPHVDDVVALNHSYGCGVAYNADDAFIPIRSVKNLTLNPNLGGEVMMVGLGCEKLEMKHLEAFLQTVDALPQERVSSLILQNEELKGFQSMVDALVRQGIEHLERLNKRRREECPLSDLVIGVQCGGSDAFSGLTANPSIGYAVDLLVRAGGTALFSEVTEVRDAAPVLASRCADKETFETLKKELDWYDSYLKRGGADRSANTTPGNKQGGLVNIVEKAMGSVVKSGSMNISGVLGPGERVSGKGLIFAATPASDFVCGTCQLASGISLQIFSTGRGTPYNLPIAPVVKLSSRRDLSQRWYDLVDLDTGDIAWGEAGIEETGWKLFHLIIEVASGRKPAAEALGLYNDLVIFNPAPIT